MPQIRLPFTVFLDNTLRVTPISTLFAMGDSNAHRFELTILREGVYDNLNGCTVYGKFYRISENAAVDLEGTVEDGKAVVVLNKSCYDHIGRFAMTVTVKDGENETTVFYGDGYMHGHRTETVITGEYIIYDINMLLQKIAEIDAATRAANEAAQNANASAGNATTASSSATTAAGNATSAAGRAKTAAAAIEGMTATATTLATGQQATADVQVVDGRYVLALGLPRGLTGVTPQITFEVATGAPGTDASAVVTGTPEAPHVLLTIPRGDVGEIGNLSINGQTPGADGSVTVGIDDIDGLRSAIDNAGGVKTVAGVSPDAAGDVALTAQDVGAASCELLWENASPTTAMGERTIALDWSGCDVLVVIYSLITTISDKCASVAIPCGAGKAGLCVFLSGETDTVASRLLELTASGMSVASAGVCLKGTTQTAASTTNKYCIPRYVYGIKGVK